MKEPEIKCSNSGLVEIEKLVPHPKNPNLHTSEQITMLAKIIKAHGFRSPIVVSAKSGFVIAGHGRLQAAKVLGMTKVPVDEQKFKNEADEYQHLIADNRIAELSDFDPSALKDLIEELDTGETDLEELGFTRFELENLMSQFYNPDDPIILDDTGVKEECTLRIVCDNLQEMEKIQQKLGITAKECSGKVALSKLG